MAQAPRFMALDRAPWANISPARSDRPFRTFGQLAKRPPVRVSFGLIGGSRNPRRAVESQEVRAP